MNSTNLKSASLQAIVLLANGLALDDGADPSAILPPSNGGALLPPAGDPNFPDDPGNAPFPSPENSTSSVLNGKISGAPYLRSSRGAIWRFDLDAAGKPVEVTSAYSTGHQVSVNGVPLANCPVQMLLVRQGEIYLEADTIWSALEQADAPISGIAHTTPPPAWTTTGTDAHGGDVALPSMPAAPPAFTDWTGKVILFGDNQAHKDMQSALDAAQPGDTIQAGPEMAGRTVAMMLSNTKPIVVDLGGRAANAGSPEPTWSPGMLIDLSPIDDPTGYPHQLGGFVPMADIKIIGLDETAAGMKETTHGGTAAVRPGAPCNITLDHCRLHKNQNGIGPSGFLHTLKATNIILLDNGLGVDDGGSHNVYASGFCVSAEFGPNVTSIVTPGGGGGHPIKSRAKVTRLIEPFYLRGADAACLNIPDGSTAVCEIGAGTIEKMAGDGNHKLVDYGIESQTNGLAGIAFKGTTIIGNCENPQFFSAGPVSFDAAVKFIGTKPAFEGGGKVTGA